MIGQELHMGGSTEDKIFAPGYGEFLTRDGKDVEALATAVPTDTVPGGVPTTLSALLDATRRAGDAAAAGDWSAAAHAVASADAAWTSFRGGEVPHLEIPWVDRALSSLGAAVRAGDELRSRQAAIDARQRVLDLELRYRSPLETDLSRFSLWTDQLLVDADAHDAAAVNGDVFTLFYMRDRLLGALTPAQLTEVNTSIDRLQVAGAEHDLVGAATAARRLRQVVAAIQAASG
jgi:hypothetical protein